MSAFLQLREQRLQKEQLGAGFDELGVGFLLRQSFGLNLGADKIRMLQAPARVSTNGIQKSTTVSALAKLHEHVLEVGQARRAASVCRVQTLQDLEVARQNGFVDLLLQGGHGKGNDDLVLGR
jgi:hypothetical protein